MLKRGFSQSSYVIIDNNKGASDRYIIKLTHQRSKLRQDINEVWVYEKGKARMLYKKQ